MRAAVLAFALCLVASSARADAMPSCGPGQHVVHNPVPPGSMHHGGGHCEYGCSVSAVGAGPGTPWLALVFALALLRRRA
jgi:MYXO-CTERM domain-containing protein